MPWIVYQFVEILSQLAVSLLSCHAYTRSQVVRRVGAHGPPRQLRSVKTAAGRQESAKVMQMLDFIKNNNANVSVSGEKALHV
jgi:hypothetical protein